MVGISRAALSRKSVARGGPIVRRSSTLRPDFQYLGRPTPRTWIGIIDLHHESCRTTLSEGVALLTPGIGGGGADRAVLRPGDPVAGLRLVEQRRRGTRV